MSRIHRAGRIFGGIIIVAGVFGILGTAGGSDNNTLSTQTAALSIIACVAAIGLGWLIFKINTPKAIRLRAAYRFNRDIDIVDPKAAQRVWTSRHGDWWDQIPTNCRQTHVRITGGYSQRIGR